MVNIFVLLLLLSLILLIIGLIKPKIFQKVTNQIPSRKKITSVFSGLIIFSFIMIGVTAPRIEKKDLVVTPPPQQVENISPPSSTPVVIATPLKVAPTNNPVSAIVAKTDSVKIPPPNNQQDNQPELYTVSSVVDGDTIKVNIDGSIETLRLIGMDTPETLDPRKLVQCFGREASNKAKELLSGKKVRLEKDLSQGDLDKYGRHLAYVYREDGLFYNKYMIEQGYAHEYTYKTPYKYQNEFKAAQKSAQENLMGLWSPNTCNGDTTQSASAVSTSTQQKTTIQTSTTNIPSGKYYTSSFYSSKFYYPASCEEWKKLSSIYLKVFDSLEALLAKYPVRTLSPQCQ